MKKYSLWATLFAVALLVGVGCGSDKTEVAWQNGTGVSGETISQIKWYDDRNNENASWSDSIAQNEKTGFQEVTSVNGYAKGFSTEESTVVDIYILRGTTPEREFTVDENSSNTFTINSAN